MLAVVVNEARPVVVVNQPIEIVVKISIINANTLVVHVRGVYVDQVVGVDYARGVRV